MYINPDVNIILQEKSLNRANLSQIWISSK